MAEDRDTDGALMVSCGVTYVEGDPEWVPPLENWPSKGGLKRRIILVADDHIGEWGKKHEWFPEKLGDTILWLQGILDQVPEEYRDAVEIEVDGDGDEYDGYRATLRISYLREPTPEELAKWNARENAGVAARVREELAELERLKAKYERSESKA
jgi:hypothetical protein